MSMAIHMPACFTETGDRANNEDNIYPPPGTATANDRLFLVCDGVGGENRGEVASSLACRSIAGYFASHPGELVSEAFIRQALAHAREAFGREIGANPDAAGMATTLTLLHLHQNHAVLVHLGDSRIYHVRDGQILFRTRDHKWVNELVAAGMLTEEEADAHPRRNVITKVIGADRSDEPEYTLITDIRPGDFFFLCTDGVLEQLYDELLAYHLRETPESGIAEIMEAIRAESIGRTGDNFSAYLIGIQSVSQPISGHDTLRI